MAKTVQVEAIIKIEGLSIKDYRPSKSNTPDLKVKRLQAEVKKQKDNLNYYLKNDYEGTLEERIKVSKMSYKKVRDDIKYRLDNKIKNTNYPSYCDSGNWTVFSSFRHIAERDLQWPPPYGITITKDTTDKEIDEMVDDIADYWTKYWEDRVKEAEHNLKNFQESPDNYYFLWLVPEPSVVLKADSNICTFSMVDGLKPKFTINIGADKFFEILSNKKTKLDVTCTCSNDDASYICNKIIINKLYKN